MIKEEGRPEFYSWTEGQWLAAEREARRIRREKEESILPTCLNCGTKPSETNGYEEKFCKCGMIHAVTKRPNRKSENEVVRELRNASK